MVLGSFSPYLYSGTLLSHPFGLKILLTLTLGSRTSFIPESLHPDDRLFHQKIPEILSDKILEPLCAHCLYNPVPPVYPSGELPILAIHTRITRYSCVGKIPRDTLRCLENSRQPTALEVLLPFLPYG